MFRLYGQFEDGRRNIEISYVPPSEVHATEVIFSSDRRHTTRQAVMTVDMVGLNMKGTLILRH